MDLTRSFIIRLVTAGVLLAAGSVYAQPTDECERYPVLFADDHYRGRALTIDSDIPDLQRLGFGDEVSSVCVPRGWRVVVYEDAGFRGDGLELAGPEWVADLQRDQLHGKPWGDRVSSVRVFRNAFPGRARRRFDPREEPCEHAPVLHSDAGLRGRSVNLSDSIPDLHGLGIGDEASSVCVPPGWTVILYEDRDFRGNRLELKGPAVIDDLKRDQPHGQDWGDRISSAEVLVSSRRTDRYDPGSSRECDLYPTLFSDDNLQGRSLRVDRSILDLHPLGFGDRVSSVCVPRGWRVTLYEHSDLQGDRLEMVGPRSILDLSRDRPQGQDWGDRVSSVRLSRR